MIRYVLCALAIIAGRFCLSNDYRGVKLPQYYRVISDVFDSTIPQGQFIISGKITENETGEGIFAAKVVEPTNKRGVLTDIDGFFSGSFSVQDSAIYFYAPDYTEVVIPGPFKDQHRYQVEVSFYKADMVVFKPVIYAYNGPSEISLDLKPAGDFTFTYPEASDGHWEFMADEFGNLSDLKSGRIYPYIFWEGIVPEPQGFSGNAGYFIQTDTCVNFLENVLTAYGLNDRERTDFITFWCPKILESPFAEIHFISNEVYQENVAQISVHPAPESMLRLFMYVIPRDKSSDFLKRSNPAIQPVNRSGFTLIEWGGSILPSSFKSSGI